MWFILCTARDSEPLFLGNIELEPPILTDIVIDPPYLVPEQPMIGGPDTSLCGQPNTYQCSGGDCIRDDQRCNGARWECLGNDDEQNCGTCTRSIVLVIRPIMFHRVVDIANCEQGAILQPLCGRVVQR